MLKMKSGLKVFLLFKKYILILEKMEVLYIASQVGKGWIEPRKILVSCGPAGVPHLSWIQGYADSLTSGTTRVPIFSTLSLETGPPAWMEPAGAGTPVLAASLSISY